MISRLLEVSMIKIEIYYKLMLLYGGSMSENKWFAIYAHYRTDVPPIRYDVISKSKIDAKKSFSKKFPWLKIYDVEEFSGLPKEDVWLW